MGSERARDPLSFPSSLSAQATHRYSRDKRQKRRDTAKLFPRRVSPSGNLPNLFRCLKKILYMSSLVQLDIVGSGDEEDNRLDYFPPLRIKRRGRLQVCCRALPAPVQTTKIIFTGLVARRRRRVDKQRGGMWAGFVGRNKHDGKCR